MNERPLHIVVDTSILIAGLRTRRGLAFRLLSMLNDVRWKVHVSVALVVEYEAVLMRQSDDLRLSRADIDDLIDGLCSIATRHSISFRWRPSAIDPDDDFLFDLAIAAQADCLVTYNARHVRDLARVGVAVVTPKEFFKHAKVSL